MPRTAYRTDIDGLRAIAVLAVVIFHIKEIWLPGGFVGVDIFFVLSGYLISQQLYLQIKQGTFSLSAFYVRRIRRIVPAMLGVIFFTVFAAQIFFRPEDAEATARSGLWSALSLGNVYFWLYQDTSYFAQSSLELPLLHLWSLGVEEQFYLFWPLALMMLGTRVLNSGVAWGIFAVIFVSTLLAQWSFSISHSFTYYMLPTRAGELLVGAYMAFFVANHSTHATVSRWANALQGLGLGMVTASLLLFDHTTVFPGIAVLLPTVGVGLLLLGGHYRDTKIGIILSWPLLRFFGLISYSLYLWHWPVLAFYRYGQFPIGGAEAVGLFFVITCLGYLSYRYIEKPFRTASGALLPIFTRYYAFPGALLVVGCLTSMKLDGVTFRATDRQYLTQLEILQDTTRPAYQFPYVCQQHEFDEREIFNPDCVLGAPREPKTLLLGDSNAAHYIGVWGSLTLASGGTFRNITMGSCPPLWEELDRFTLPERRAHCAKGVHQMLTLASTMETVIISADWTFYEMLDEGFLDAFNRTLTRLTDQGVTIVIFGKAATFKNFNRKCDEKALSFPLMNCTLADQSLSADVIAINRHLATIAHSNPLLHYIDINDVICPQGQCQLYDENGKRLYYDESHISMIGSWQLGEKWVATLSTNSILRQLAAK